MSSLLSTGSGTGQNKGKGKARQHTRTPRAENGGISRSSSSSSLEFEEDDLIMPLSDRSYDLHGQTLDSDEVPEEDDRLLATTDDGARGLKDRNTVRFPASRPAGIQREGWIQVVGYSLPRPLVYLFSLPPILILLSLLTRPFTSNNHPSHTHYRYPTLRNGTTSFHPTVILISLDGFRPSYLSTHSHLLPNLIALGSRTPSSGVGEDDSTDGHGDGVSDGWGVRAESMQPVFPTLTFPNHWSLMTGLYPESHGIIANDFWDPLFASEPSSLDVSHTRKTALLQHEQGSFFDPPTIRRGETARSDNNLEIGTAEEDFPGKRSENGAQFVYTDENKSWDGHWWWGEPIWSVVERVGKKAAVIMWPGPPVTTAGISPSYFVPYRALSPNDKLTQIFAYLDKPLSTRPEFIASYFPEIDQNAHRAGPMSIGVNESLALMDEMIGGLVQGLDQRNLTGLVNVVIVSDHGMTETSNARMIYLDEILGEEGINAIEHQDGWPSVGLRFEEGTDVEAYLKILLDAAEGSNGTFAVYTHETMPERWHFSHGHRIAPIYIVPKVGWAITTHHEHFVVFEGDYQPKGNHGYDNASPEMQAIFFAQGPIAESLRMASTQDGSSDMISLDPPIMKGFKNLEIFSLVTALLGIPDDEEPPHNGTEGFWDRYLDSF
ncbi:type I phosphodiesterase/nucleotide pyrophosphatase [Kwoniella heveanensis BCC8398]|uniref:Type I phosphodiesterase/nucleotide pyrophosphatase n=1 Tax=Kwoniella heveanensis BCC8398 TaxID=1296120 RepID=A0A1B9GHP0_9TREE|nr:type I phosphodiesterase/nucleotide pyrophosphatase [Kwoniella heveanensis BCC8398]